MPTPSTRSSLLRDGRAATAGADGRIAIWTSGKAEPDAVLEGHTAPIAALAVSPDGATLASASWDHTVRLWPLAGGAPRVLEGHTQNVNGVAFAPDGRTLVSVSYDQSVRIWPLVGRAAADRRCDAEPAQRRCGRRRWRDRGRRRRRQALFPDRRTARVAGEVAAGPRPVISIAISPDGALVAAAGIGGSVAVIDRKTRSSGAHAGRSRAAGLVGRVPAGQPHAADRRRRQHHPPLERGDRRADRSAAAGNGGRSAGRLCRRPRRGDLSRLRRLPYARRRAGQPGRARRWPASSAGGSPPLPGYNFSEALKRLDIVWTPETVSKLFEIGPAAYTPGTKMPEQRIGSEQDRAALVQFLERATKR